MTTWPMAFFARSEISFNRCFWISKQEKETDWKKKLCEKNGNSARCIAPGLQNTPNRIFIETFAVKKKKLWSTSSILSSSHGILCIFQYKKRNELNCYRSWILLIPYDWLAHSLLLFRSQFHRSLNDDEIQCQFLNESNAFCIIKCWVTINLGHPIEYKQ